MPTQTEPVHQQRPGLGTDGYAGLSLEVRIEHNRPISVLILRMLPFLSSASARMIGCPGCRPDIWRSFRPARNKVPCWAVPSQTWLCVPGTDRRHVRGVNAGKCFKHVVLGEPSGLRLRGDPGRPSSPVSNTACTFWPTPPHSSLPRKVTLFPSQYPKALRSNPNHKPFCLELETPSQCCSEAG